MKRFQFFLSLIICLGLSYWLNRSIPAATPIPPIGPLLSPFQGFWQNAETIDRQLTTSLSAPGLSQTVEVVYDDRMVPHIFAQNNLDAFFVQGYILAQNRLWQMDIATRSIGGRLAEVMGENLLARDQLMRRKGLLYAAEKAVDHWKNTTPEEFRFVEAYTAGINHYLNQLAHKDYPVEFKLLNYQPEAWTPLKSALFLKSMAYSLASRESDLERNNSYATLGQETFDLLFPGRNPNNDPIIPKEVKWEFDPIPVDSTVVSAPPQLSHHQPYPKMSGYLGSNNWAVAGSKTASGFPILCSDPHLILTLPAIWYEIQIHTPEFNTYGVCLPGFPGVVIGFNEHIAWGMTNVGHDVLDWYHIKWVDEKREAYWLDGQQKQVEKRVEKYQLKDGRQIQDTVRYTFWGPIVYEPEDHPKADLAMRWMAHDPVGNELKAFYMLNKANNHQDYLHAAQQMGTPAQNIVFASDEGDIAITVSGALPLKRKGQGRFIQDGSLSKNNWAGIIPSAHNPAVKNPTRAFVASANQCSTDETYPYFYHGFRDGFEDYRGRILNQKLARMNQIKVEDMQALQNDVYGLRAAESLPLLLQHLDKSALDDRQKQLISLLETWDFEYRKDAKAPVLYDEWYDHFYQLCWDEIDQHEDSLAMLFPKYWRTTALLKEQPDHFMFDLIETPKKETAKDIVLLAFQEMSQKVAQWQEDQKALDWHQHKVNNIRHMGRIPAFSSAPIKLSGDGQALNAIQNRAGPSWRMIVNMGPQRSAYGIYPGGQSGNPGSPYYDQMVQKWADGTYYELLFLETSKDQHERIIGRQEFGEQ